jgi:hypothetical protein
MLEETSAELVGLSGEAVECAEGKVWLSLHIQALVFTPPFDATRQIEWLLTLFAAIYT